MFKSKNITKKNIKDSVLSSSKIEGLSFVRAKKNSFIIKKLQTHGRAFSL